MHVVAIFPEGYFHDCYSFGTLPEARAFSAGISVGTGQYGAGSCHTFIVPGEAREQGELEDMKIHSVGYSIDQSEFDKGMAAATAMLAAS